MTTIAWDGRTLAGDQLADRGGLQHMVTTKVWRLDDGRLYGGSGDWPDVIAVRDWLNGKSDKPTVISDYAGILVGLDGSCEIVGARVDVRHPAPFPFFAVGSGRDYAIAAMHLGCSAAAAISVARLYDTYTGGEIIELELRP